MSTDRPEDGQNRRTVIRDWGAEAEVSLDPLHDSKPRLPAAFVGRRRFSLKPADEPPPEEDPIERARGWEPVEEESERETIERPYVVEESGRIDEVPPSPELPRLPVAGALPVADGLELPPPPEFGWPTETPAMPHPPYAEGADASLEGAQAADEEDSAVVEFSTSIPPPPDDDVLGHTLAPRETSDFMLKGWPEPPDPPPADPRPSLDQADRFPLRMRPGGAAMRSTPGSLLTQQPVPSPFRQPQANADAETMDRAVLPGVEAVPKPAVDDTKRREFYVPPAKTVLESTGPPALARQAEPAPEPLSVHSKEGWPKASGIDFSRPAPLDFDPEPSVDIDADALEALPKRRSMPGTTTLAAIGCFVAFVVLGGLGALGLAIALWAV
ncbi:MAG: hypothetical protein AAGA48_18305 [Myxococcota bacterium]